MEASALDEGYGPAWSQLRERMREEQSGRPRKAWGDNLLLDGPPATVGAILDGLLEATLHYAWRRGYLGDIPEAGARETLHAFRAHEYRGLLARLAELPPRRRGDAVQSAPKQLFTWQLMPAAVALRDGRVPDLSLAGTARPRWHSPFDEGAEPQGTSWFYPAVGLVGPTNITGLSTDETLGSVGAKRVENEDKLIDSLFDTAIAGYVRPLIRAYGARLTDAGVRHNPLALLASGIAPLVHPARGGLISAAAKLCQSEGPVPRDGADFQDRSAAARRAAAQTSIIPRVVARLRRELSGPDPVRAIPVFSTADPQVAGHVYARVCCEAHGGDPANRCNYCALEFPQGRPVDRVEASLDESGLRVTAAGAPLRDSGGPSRPARSRPAR